MWDMTNLKLGKLINRYRRDERGSFAMVWGVSAIAVMIGVGAAYDLSKLNSQQKQAQHLADTMALAASVAVDQDNTDRLVEGRAYSYQDVTGQYSENAKGLTGYIEYDIVDDQDPNNEGLDDDKKARLLARATVSGEYETAFMSILPSVTSVKYGATSDVAYSLRGGKPASVFFAVDNSGSMGWLDSSGANKLASLEASMKQFMDVLDGVNTDQNDIFRSAMFPYSQDYYGSYSSIDSDGVIPGKVIDPDWGTLTDGEINAMSTLYGTDSSGALEDAQQAFAGENAEHLAKNDAADPLKYMIFMSDGSNNSSYECKTENVWVDGDDEYWIDTYRGWNTRYNSYRRWFDRWVIYYPATDGGFEDQEVCTNDYHADVQSVASCNAMKDDGVTVYSVGYSLIPGANGVSASEIARAKKLLEDCASSEEHYILADNASELDAVFEEIGEEIIEEVIRIKR